MLKAHTSSYFVNLFSFFWVYHFLSHFLSSIFPFFFLLCSRKWLSSGTLFFLSFFLFLFLKKNKLYSELFILLSKGRGAWVFRCKVDHFDESFPAFLILFIHKSTRSHQHSNYVMEQAIYLHTTILLKLLPGSRP